MKANWNGKYTTIAIYCFIVISCSIFLFLTIFKFNNVLSKIDGMIVTLRPFIIGGALAYLLNFILMFYEKKIMKIKSLSNLKEKGVRALGLLCTYLTAFIMVYLFLKFVLPQLIDSIIGLVNNIPQYVNEASRIVTDIVNKINLDAKYLNMLVEQWDIFVNNMVKLISNMVPLIGNYVVIVTSSILNIFIGLIVSIYLLIDKEKYIAVSRKITYSLLPESVAKRILEIMERSNYTFGKFISGKILNSIIIGILTFIILTLFKMPYTLLISVIIGITNVIPFFGPFFGAIPSTIILLFVSPIKAVWFVGIIFVIQQLDGNIIGPKILGDSIGISAFWILFSLLIFSKLFGFVGMIIGVPIFAVIYSIIKELVELKLRKKGLPVDTISYKK